VFEGQIGDCSDGRSAQSNLQPRGLTREICRLEVSWCKLAYWRAV
jgi:hypothetical protein